MISAPQTRMRQWPGQRLDRLSHGVFGGFVCTLAALLLASCASSGAGAGAARATPTVRVAPTETTGPSPVLEPLGPPPQNCAITPPPQQMDLPQLGPNSNAHLIGGGPFWFYGTYYQSVLHVIQLGGRQSPALAADQSAPWQMAYGARRGSTRMLAAPALQRPLKEWPGAKMVVEVGPNYSQPVTLRLRNQGTGELAWWTDGQAPPGAATRTLVLDPLADTESVGVVPGVPDIPHGEVSPGWREWGLFPLFSAAGCYQLDVSWSGGSWQSVFAVGS